MAEETKKTYTIRLPETVAGAGGDPGGEHERNANHAAPIAHRSPL